MKKLFALLMLIIGVITTSFAHESHPKDDPPLTGLLESLTSEEKAWLKEHSSIRVGGPKSFPPFHYYDENSMAKGIGTEYVMLIAHALGLKVEYEEPIPWPLVLEKIQNRQLDLIACAAKSASREEFLEFSTPYLSLPMVIVTCNDAPFVGGLQDLHGKKVALIKKVMTREWLARDGIDVVPHLVDTPLAALQAVSAGQADAAINNLAAGSYLMQKYGLANLKLAAPTPWGNYQLHFAARKDWPLLAGIISKALAAIPLQRHTAIRNNWISVRYEFGISHWDVAKWVGIGLVPVLIFALVVLLYNRRLRREITERQRAQKEREKVIGELKTALGEVKQLSGLLPICASCKKIRDDQGYWRQVEEYFMKHSEAEFSHSICPDCARSLYPDWKPLAPQNQSGD